MREAVDEVHIDAVEAKFPGFDDEVSGELVRLNAVNRLLDLGVKILHAHAEAVEAKSAQNFEVSTACNARIDFDAQLRVRCEGEAFACEIEQVLDLFWSEICGGTSAPMKLHDGARPRDAEADAVNFLFQDVEIRRRDFLVFLDDDVTRAEKAQAFAKRNVHVKRNRCTSGVSILMNFLQVIYAEGIVPDGRSRVTRVARPRAIIASKKLFVDAKLFAHLPKAWISDAHESSLAHNVANGLDYGLPQASCGRAVCKLRLLAHLDEKLCVFNGRCGKDAVAKVQDMAYTIELPKDLVGLGANSLLWCVEQ